MKECFSRNPLTANRKPLTEKGFTLVELLVAGVIVGVVFLGIITVFLAGQKSFTDTSAQILSQHKANLAMECIVKGLREVSRTGEKGRGIDFVETFGAISPSDGTTDIAGLFTVFVDIDGNGLDNEDKRYRYWLDSTDIKKSTQIYNGGWPTSWHAEIIVPQIKINGLEFMYCKDIAATKCEIKSDGIQIKIIPAADNETYIFKIPYHY